MNAVRQTNDGLRAQYNQRTRHWEYFRWDTRAQAYVLTGSTRRFQS